MSKEVSKRQLRREQVRRKEQISRMKTIGLIALGAIFIAFFIIWPQVRPIEVKSVEPNPRPMANGTAMGDPNAPVTIDVFEDFQCPACRDFTQSTEPMITDAYVATGQVYYVFHHYAFLDGGAINGESQQAANASMCAADQGKFWEYHDMLFANWNGENLGAFNDRKLEAFAKKIGLDTAKFSKCFTDNIHRAEIEADYKLGNDWGVNGTPSVFINGKLFDPGHVPQFNEIQAAIDALLAGK